MVDEGDDGLNVKGDDWLVRLSHALDEGCDFEQVRQITLNRPLPLNSDLRPRLWQMLLGVSNKMDPFLEWDGLYDLPQQSILRACCHDIVGKLGVNCNANKLALVSDIESVMTLCCKNRDVTFSENGGWSDLLQLLIVLSFTKQQLYHVLFALTTKYVPRTSTGRPFDLFRLLLLYHDVELCSFLDTRKVTPDKYALHWFTTLFAHHCSLDVALLLVDIFLQQADPFLVFFMALVFLINAKERIMVLSVTDPLKIAETIEVLPCQLSADDIEDFCQIAMHYSARTPQSFRRDYHGPLFGSHFAEEFETCSVHFLLCLPVSVQELMVDNPASFRLAVASVCSLKQKGHASEHWCFLGSGRSDEDQCLHMVIAYFLQHGSEHVSQARGGYAALHELLRESLSTRLKNHSVKKCVACNESDATQRIASDGGQELPQQRQSVQSLEPISVLGKLTSVVKSKSSSLKDRVSGYIAYAIESPESEERHVNPSERIRGKQYRNVPSVFSIGENDSDSHGSDDEQSMQRGASSTFRSMQNEQRVKIATFVHQPEVLAYFSCHQICNKQHIPSYLVISTSHLTVIRESEVDANWGFVVSRRRLETITKITSKKRVPEVLSIRYTSARPAHAGADADVSWAEQFHVAKAGDCAKVLKNAIFETSSPSGDESRLRDADVASVNQEHSEQDPQHGEQPQHEAISPNKEAASLQVSCPNASLLNNIPKANDSAADFDVSSALAEVFEEMDLCGQNNAA